MIKPVIVSLQILVWNDPVFNINGVDYANVFYDTYFFSFFKIFCTGIYLRTFKLYIAPVLNALEVYDKDSTSTILATKVCKRVWIEKS